MIDMPIALMSGARGRGKSSIRSDGIRIPLRNAMAPVGPPVINTAIAQPRWSTRNRVRQAAKRGTNADQVTGYRGSAPPKAR